MSVSPQTNAVLTTLEASLPKAVPVTVHQLSYPAPSVNVLFAGLSFSFWSLVSNRDWDQLMHVNLPNYIGQEQQGEAELIGYLTHIYYYCYPAGQEPMVVLAGYSQGSMVVHNILNEAAANPNTGYLSLIKGAALIADPESMKWSNVTNFGTAPPGDYGLCKALDEFIIPHEKTSGSCVPPGTTTDVAKALSSKTYQVCDAGDLVCDTSGALRLNSHGIPLTNWTKLKLDFKNGSRIHTTHYMGGAVTVAARLVARNLIRDGLGSVPAPQGSGSFRNYPGCEACG